MATRADLLAAAERSAAAAIADGADWQVRESEIRNAKTALEAAALVQNIGPGEIEVALGKIQAELEGAGVLAESMELEPAEFLKRTLAAVVHWRNQVEVGRGIAFGYGALRTLLELLERDFTAADTETSRRIAARIHRGLEEADQKINKTTEGG